MNQGRKEPRLLYRGEKDRFGAYIRGLNLKDNPHEPLVSFDASDLGSKIRQGFQPDFEGALEAIGPVMTEVLGRIDPDRRSFVDTYLLRDLASNWQRLPPATRQTIRQRYGPRYLSRLPDVDQVAKDTALARFEAFVEHLDTN